MIALGKYPEWMQVCFHCVVYMTFTRIDPPRVTGPQRHLRRRQSEGPISAIRYPGEFKDWLRVKMIISITGVALLFMLLVVLYFPPLIEREIKTTGHTPLFF
jgi:hypothetical protein